MKVFDIGAVQGLPDSPSICSGRSSCKWCPTVSPPPCTTLCSTCEGSWELLFYYPRQTRHSRGCFHPHTSAPRPHAPTVSKIIYIKVQMEDFDKSLSLSILNQTILLSQTKFFQFTRQISISSYCKYYLKQIIKRFYSFQEFSLHIFSNLEQNETFVLLKLVTKKKKRMVFFLPFFKGITIELCLVRSISSPVR